MWNKEGLVIMFQKHVLSPAKKSEMSRQNFGTKDKKSCGTPAPPATKYHVWKKKAYNGENVLHARYTFSVEAFKTRGFKKKFNV